MMVKGMTQNGYTENIFDYHELSRSLYATEEH